MPPSDDGPPSNEANDRVGADDAVLVAESTEDLQVRESPDDDLPAVETLRVDGQISGDQEWAKLFKLVDRFDTDGNAGTFLARDAAGTETRAGAL